MASHLGTILAATSQTLTTSPLWLGIMTWHVPAIDARALHLTILKISVNTTR